MLAWQIGRAVRDTNIMNFADFVGEDDGGESAGRSGSGRRDQAQSPVEMAHNLAVWRAVYRLEAIHVEDGEGVSDGG